MKKEPLDMSKIAHLAPDEPGIKARVNHNVPGECQGSSRSLVIWRNTDGSVGAKCFRCHRGGRMHDRPSLFKSAPKNKPIEFGLPKDIVYDWAKMPVKSTTYLNRYTTEADTKRQGIGWSEAEERLIFPATNNTCKEPGWQGKSFDREPRYVTRTLYPDYMYTHLDKGTKSVLICEDLLSALAANRILSSFALLGTGINDHGIVELLQYHEFYIWLDNDNRQVKKAQLDLYNTLSLYGDAYVIKVDREPKECTAIEITTVIENINGTNS